MAIQRLPVTVSGILDLVGTRSASGGSSNGGGPTLLASLLDLLLPRVCLGCGQHGCAWCLDCVTVGLDPTPHRPDPCPPGLPALTTAASYSGSVRLAILAAKERDRRELDRALGAMLAVAVGRLISSGSRLSSVPGPVWLVPVPASPGALRERGRDHLADWTRWAVRRLRAARVEAHRVPALRRRSGGVDSVGLDADQRAANLRGVFTMGRITPPPGTWVVIVDDVVTTGATLAAAAGCLSAGLDREAAELGAAVVGATQRDRKTGLSLADRKRTY